MLVPFGTTGAAHPSLKPVKGTANGYPNRGVHIMASEQH